MWGIEGTHRRLCCHRAERRGVLCGGALQALAACCRGLPGRWRRRGPPEERFDGRVERASLRRLAHPYAHVGGGGRWGSGLGSGGGPLRPGFGHRRRGREGRGGNLRHARDLDRRGVAQNSPRGVPLLEACPGVPVPMRNDIPPRQKAGLRAVGDTGGAEGSRAGRRRQSAGVAPLRLLLPATFPVSPSNRQRVPLYGRRLRDGAALRSRCG